ncbi:MAG: hypothetical protein OHK0011_08930 [Turneriella sp.]
MKSLVVLFTTFTTLPLLAEDGQITWLNLNTPHRLIGNNVRVRSAPDAKAKVEAELRIGMEVTPLEQTSNSMTVDGVQAPWYKVRYAVDGGHAEGYVWGNLIARAFAVSKTGELFLFGTGRRQKDISVGTEYTSQVRVALDGEERARLEVKEGTSFEARYEAALSNGRGLEGVSNIFAVKFVQEYCAGKGNTMFFFWNGQKLLHAHSSIDGADAPHYAIEKQIFPSDKGGRKGFVILEQEYGDHDDPKSVKKENILLKWNGKKLEKSK